VTGVAQADPALALGLSTLAGKLISRPVAEAQDLPFTDPAELLDGGDVVFTGRAGRGDRGDSRITTA
jgi:hypothetical protein